MPTQQDWMEAQKQRMAPQTPDTIGRMLMGMGHPGSGGNAELTAGDYTLRQRLADILAKVYGGNDSRAAQSFGRGGADLASIAPGSGQILSGDDAIRAAGKGDVSGAALAGLGALPGAGPEARAAAEGGDALTNAMRQLELPLPHTPQPPRGFQAWHGSPDPNLDRISSRHAVEARGATFHASNPDVAEMFTTPREYGEPVWDAPPGKVYQTQLDPRYPFEVPSHEAQKFIDDTAHQQRVIDEAMRKGHDMVIARNVKEGFGGEAIPTDVYAALRDEIIKMRR